MREYLLKILDESVEISLSYGSHNDITWFSYTSMMTVKMVTILQRLDELQ
jgi:hypothetical protein